MNSSLTHIKRRWKIAMRRYVLNSFLGVQYAAHFGIDIRGFRNWIASQFYDGMSWDNFGDVWYLEFVVPVSYFDLNNDAELRLCMNFINVKVAKIIGGKKDASLCVEKAVIYFTDIFKITKYQLSNDMAMKLSSMKSNTNAINNGMEKFLDLIKEDINRVHDFTSEEFVSLNEGMSIKDILFEKEMLKKFGS